MANFTERTASHTPPPPRQQATGAALFTSSRIDWPIEWACFDPLSYPLGSSGARLGFITTRSRTQFELAGKNTAIPSGSVGNVGTQKDRILGHSSEASMKHCISNALHRFYKIRIHACSSDQVQYQYPSINSGLGQLPGDLSITTHLVSYKLVVFPFKFISCIRSF